MHYMGGKSRIAKQIASVMLASTDERSTYVEPFIGAGSVAAQMAPHFERAYLSDASPDLIALWRALQRGWEPPEHVSEEMYAFYRTAPISAMRGFVGYGCSFGGKWFGGYARHSRPCCGNPSKTFASHSASSLVKKIGRLRDADFFCLDYRELAIPDNAVVYCDPPYAGTTGYGRTGAFGSDQFWEWATELSRHASVYVSEYSAPDNWHATWSGHVQVSMRVDNNSARATEHLWTCHPLQERHGLQPSGAQRKVGHSEPLRCWPYSGGDHVS